MLYLFNMEQNNDRTTLLHSKTRNRNRCIRNYSFIHHRGSRNHIRRQLPIL